MSARHTPEPWYLRRGGFQVLRGDGRILCKTDIEHNDENRENARRIVACVNACTGLSTEELEKISTAALFTDYVNMKQQRDELLKAVRMYIVAGVGNSTDYERQAKARDYSFDAIRFVEKSTCIAKATVEKDK